MTRDLKKLRMVVFKEAHARRCLRLRGRIVLVKSFSCIWKTGEIMVVSFRVCMVYPSCKILALFNYLMELNCTYIIEMTIAYRHSLHLRGNWLQCRKISLHSEDFVNDFETY